MVVISLPHASLLHPVALRRLPAPINPASYLLSRPGAAIPLPCFKCSKRGFSGMLYPTARTKPETPLSTSTALPLVLLHIY